MALTFYDFDENIVATLNGSGELQSGGILLGYLNEDGSAGNLDQQLVGEISGNQVLNSSEEIVGYVDSGKGTLRDANDTHLATIESDGTIKDRSECKVGRVKPWSYHSLNKLAGYVFFFNTNYVKDAASKPQSSPAKVQQPIAPKPTVSNIDTTKQVTGFDESDQSISKEEERLMRHVTASKEREKTAQVTTSTAPKKSLDDIQDDRGLVKDNDEKARREEERFGKFLGYNPTDGNAHHGTTVQSKQTEYTAPVEAQVASTYELEVWHEINRVRQAPKDYIPYLTAMKGNFHGNVYKYPGTNTSRKTQEGELAVEEAIDFLHGRKAMASLKLSNGLSLSSRDLVKLAGKTSNLASVETDGESAERLSRYGSWGGRLLQNVALGNMDPKDVICHWLIDDGNKNRDHRQALFSDGVASVGVSSGPHVDFTRIVVSSFCGTYTEGGNNNSDEPVVLVADNIPAVSFESEYKVGPFTDVGDRYFVDITNLGCPVQGLKVSLNNNGLEVHINRKIKVNGVVKESLQKFGLPFAVTETQVLPEYEDKTGKLTINFMKHWQEPSNETGDVANFNVAGTGSAEKVTMASSSNSEGFTFTPVPGKYDTSVVASIEGKKLSFGLTYSFETVVDGEAVVKTMKITSSFTLPYELSKSQVVVQPGNPMTIQVLKSKPSSGGETQVSQPDVVIPIKSI